MTGLKSSPAMTVANICTWRFPTESPKAACGLRTDIRIDA